MRPRNIIRHLAVILCFSSILAASSAGFCREAVDNGIYAGLLQKYVKNGVVDYAGLKKDEGAVDRYLRLLARTDPLNLSGNERLAFYINAYNISAIKLVLMGYPHIRSIKDMGSWFRGPWKKEIVEIDEKPLSLDDIENKMIRRAFHDPRVHFALNCASKSCPPLRSEPYSGGALDRQLDSAARAFINNPRSNYLKGDTLHLSKIFYWYEGDFKKEGGVLAFLMRYADPGLRKKLEERAGRIKIEYLPYDWSLNGK